MNDTRDTAKTCERCAQTAAIAIADELNNPDGPTVREALTRTCDLCSAGIDELCCNPIAPGKPLPGRLIHIGRTTPR